tara:strand:+ start:857 stop:1051 length:195 start_codon:yes stop_codon:yes gene_type:complete
MANLSPFRMYTTNQQGQAKAKPRPRPRQGQGQAKAKAADSVVSLGINTKSKIGVAPSGISINTK